MSDVPEASATTTDATEKPAKRHTGDNIEVIDQWAKKGHERGKQWLFRVRDRRTRGWISKAFAKGEKDKGWDWAEDQRSMLHLQLTSSGALPFKVVAADYVTAGRGRGNNERYMDEIERIAAAVVEAGAGDLRATDFQNTVRDWIIKAPSFAEGKEPPCAKTKNRWLVQLKAIAKLAVTKFGLGSNPLTGIKPFKEDDTVKTTLRLGELRMMVGQPPTFRIKDRKPDHYYLAACALVYAGLRIGEAMHLRWEWIDFEACTITLRVNRDAKGKSVWAPKGNKERIIPLQAEFAEVLRADPDHPTSGWVVDDEMLRGFEAKNQWKAFRRYLGRCGIDARDLSPHCTRHTWTALMLATGVSPSKVRRALGHKSLTTTDGYADAEAGYSVAVKDWPRGEFQLRPKPAAPAVDPVAAMRAALAAEAKRSGQSVEQLLAALAS